MLFCQFGKAQSLREITDGLSTCEGKLAHLGIKAPKRSTLSYANSHRPWELFQATFYDLLEACHTVASKKKRKFRFKNKLYSIDSTTIDLCLSTYNWAKFRQTKGAIKLHMRLDHDGYLPDFAVVTEGRVSDIKALSAFDFEPGSMYVFDRGYNDYCLFGELCEKGVSFVTRMKDNAAYDVLDSKVVPEGWGVITDEEISLNGHYAEERCPQVLRRIDYFDLEKNRSLVFLTNNMTLAAETIAKIYKERWKIELFFKAIKQNLKIKTFVGTSANAVKIQIWTALIAILLLRFMQLSSSYGWALSNLAALLRMNLFTYRDLWQWLNHPFETPQEFIKTDQMELKLT
jgi:transposase